MHETLRDIKPFIMPSDHSLYLFVTTLIVALLLALYLFKKAYTYAQRHCSIDCERYYYNRFIAIDWSKPKEASYLATRYGLALAKDRRRRELFYQLRERLDRYKYEKESTKVDEETIRYYNLYKQVCDESL